MVLVGGLVCLASSVRAQDWPQWRGPDRNGKVTDFKAPKVWPKELTRKWRVPVGDGVATPALAGDRLYVFSRQEGNEVLRCLEADTGKEVWAKKQSAAAFEGPSKRFPGPRASPAVADGKVVALGVHGALSCYDAANGSLAWQKNDFKGSVPNFYTASSPIILNGLCIAQMGGGRGGIVAYELASGTEKWRWVGEGTSYASPSLLTLGDTRAVVAWTSGNIVAVDLANGKPLWKTAFKTRYNASTPVGEGDVVVYSGAPKGTTAVRLEKKDKEMQATPLWNNPDHSVIYNTPVIREGFLYGLSDRNRLFCLDMKDGKTAWTAPLVGSGGFGSIVAAGPVMMGLTTAGELTVFEPGGKGYKELAKYPIGKNTYAYPIVSGQRIFIKDQDSVALWQVTD